MDEEPLLARATSTSMKSTTSSMDEHTATATDFASDGDEHHHHNHPGGADDLGATSPSPTPTPARGVLERQGAQKVTTLVNYKVASNIKFRLLLCECVRGVVRSIDRSRAILVLARRRARARARDGTGCLRAWDGGCRGLS
jgi:hypothetical protein